MKITDWIIKTEEYGEFKCKVPCSKYSVLLDAELIKDPFIGLNEHEVTEISRTGCEYSASFDVNVKELKEFALLKFHGLDTLCKIYFNGELLGKTHDMHRTFEFNVKPYLKEKDNRIVIKFDNPLDYCDKMNKKRYLFTNNDSYKGSAHIRKASYMFGWDWGPVLPDMGIWKDVEFLTYDAKIENVLILQEHKSDSVVLNFEIETKGKENGYTFAAIVDGKEYKSDRKNFSAEIKNPKLWWPNGLGEQNLYNIEFRMEKNGIVEDILTKRIGLRQLEISREQDKYGEEFCFKINGKKIFAMGANYIPQDNILNRINKKRTEELIRQCIAANYNCIRIWGGGYYPEDDFYDLCDIYGLIVWQDFMFACNNIYLSEQFLEDIKNEAIDNLKRLRHHASLGLLCGNNEMEWGLEIWGVSTELIRADYLQWYEHILPDICEKYAPQTFYWSASPSSGGGFQAPNDPNRGDVHYWEVWHGNKPFEDYRNYYFRFLSEFGFESYPSMKTIRYFAKESDMNIMSEVMENRQKCKVGTQRILTYLSDNYLYPEKLENFVYASQLLQADAIRYGVEHMRRFRGRCMGAVYWQVNDCWPGISWSSLDYFGRWKALHYSAKKFYAPILLSLHNEDFETVFNISNETLNRFKGKLKIYVKDRDFNEIYSEEKKVLVESLSSSDIATIDFFEYIKGHEKEYFIEGVLLNYDNSEVMRQTLMFVKPKRFAFNEPNIDVQTIKDGDNLLFKVTSDTFARGVEIDFSDIDVKLSDNYFDITTKEGVIIKADGDFDEKTLIRQIRLKSVYDIK